MNYPVNQFILLKFRMMCSQFKNEIRRAYGIQVYHCEYQEWVVIAKSCKTNGEWEEINTYDLAC